VPILIGGYNTTASMCVKVRGDYAYVAAGHGGLFVIEIDFPDIDEDGVDDRDDAFPSDPAASRDTDDDGYPDEWNAGKTVEDSITGLKLDEFPEDPEKWEEAEDDDGPGFGLAGLLLVFVSCLYIFSKKE